MREAVTQPACLVVMACFFKASWLFQMDQPASCNVPAWGYEQAGPYVFWWKTEENWSKLAELVSDSKFKWTEKLIEDLLTALSNFKTMEFQNKDYSADKPHQYEEVQEELVRINKSYLNTFRFRKLWTTYLCYSAKLFRWRRGYADRNGMQNR